MDAVLNQQIIEGTSLVSLIGFVIAFLFPLVVKLVQKIAKRDLTSEEKRSVTFILVGIASVGVMIFTWSWNGFSWNEVYKFALALFMQFISGTGTLWTVYNLIIKKIPAIDKA